MRLLATPALLAALSVAGLASCAGQAVSECPPLVAYDQATLDRLADELEAAPADAAWPAFIVDYRALRDQIRACR